MLVRHSGTIRGNKDASYVYGILIGSYVYFGETGDLPPKRWGQHLGDAGTFTSKLIHLTPEKIKALGTLIFVGVCCEPILKLQPSMQKIARRMVEEELHRRYFLDKTAVHAESEIVSSPPPVSRSIVLPFDPRQLAIEAYELICAEFHKEQQ